MKNMNNDELRKEREKALRKREAYIKNKNSDSSKIFEKKTQDKNAEIGKNSKNELR